MLNLQNFSRARAIAVREWGRQWLRHVARVATFGFAMQLAWYMVGSMPYLLAGGDEEEKGKATRDAMRHAAVGGMIEGLTGGDVLSDGDKNAGAEEGRTHRGASLQPGAMEADYHAVIDDMFERADFDKSAHQRERYNLGKTPAWMRRVGVVGDNFSLSFKNIKTHQGKDADHDLTREEWHQLPQSLKKPFAITRYKGASDRFRIYVNILHNGHYVAVGVDVKRINQGRNLPMLEVNSIKTAFAHRGGIGGAEELIAYDKEITPEQEALLRGLNFREYPTIQELSDTKLLNNSDKSAADGGKSGKMRFSAVDDGVGGDENVLYRDDDGDVSGAAWPSGMGLEETVTRGAIELSRRHRDDLKLRNAACKAIGGNLSKLRRAMAVQRRFDAWTVKSVADLARTLLESGMMDAITRGETKRLLSSVKNSVGRADIDGQVRKVFDIMVNSTMLQD